MNINVLPINNKNTLRFYIKEDYLKLIYLSYSLIDESFVLLLESLIPKCFYAHSINNSLGIILILEISIIVDKHIIALLGKVTLNNGLSVIIYIAFTNESIFLIEIFRNIDSRKFADRDA